MDLFNKDKAKRISLAYQDLTEVPSKIIKANCGLAVEELDLSHNNIMDYNFLLEFPSLHTLILDHNGISSHTKFPELPRIHTLWLNHNKITNLGIFMSMLAKSFPNLKFLCMMDNEAAPSYFNGGSYIQYKDYRHFVISQLPNLMTLDDCPVEREERLEAERIYAALMPDWHPFKVKKRYKKTSAEQN